MTDRVPSPTEMLELVVASLAEPTAEPDLTVGQAVWRLFGAGAAFWEELSLAPVGGGWEAFDAIYRATAHGVHVLEPPAAAVADWQAQLGDGPRWEVPVAFADEVVARFAAVPRPGAPDGVRAALAAAAPTIGLMLVELAQRRRMQAELAHVRALARFGALLWTRRSLDGLLEAAASGLREAWRLERVRIFVRDPSGRWPLCAEAVLAGGGHGQRAELADQEVARIAAATEPAIVSVAPAAWLVPVAERHPPYGALLLDNAVTASPLDRVDDLVEATRALAAAWGRLAPVRPPIGLRAAGAPEPEGAELDRLGRALAESGARAACGIAWRLLGPADRARRRDQKATAEAGRILERVALPHAKVVGLGPSAFAAVVAHATVDRARELAEAGVEALAPSWRSAAAVASVADRPLAEAAARLWSLLDQAAGWHAGAVLAEGDRVQAAPGGGIALAPGAVLRPAALRLDLAAGSVPLTRTEVRILRALATADGPLAAGELVRRVWPGDPTMGVMNLYPHVHELRRRLAVAWPAGLRVRTVRGQGYVLAADAGGAESA